MAARQLFGEVRDIFAALGTWDEQAMVEDALSELDRGSGLSPTIMYVLLAPGRLTAGFQTLNFF